MKTLFLSLLLLASVQNSQAKTLVISDVDDTIKMSDVLGKTSHLIYNGLFGDKAFSGMSELYQSMQSPDTKFFYVSGSPRIIRSRIEEFLEENNFPHDFNTVLKGNRDQDTLNFKIRSIKGLIELEKPDSLILIGDDTQHDPEVYETISNEYPGLVKATYIRSVQNLQGPGKEFFSAVEIAAAEIEAGRMDAKFLPFIVNGFVKQTHMSGIVLRNRHCPKEGSEVIEAYKQQATDAETIDLYSRTQAKILKTCK